LKMTLRRRPDFYLEESLSSYIHRVTVLNRYESISYILTECKISSTTYSSNLYSSQHLNVISNLTTKSIELLQSHSNYLIVKYIGKDLAVKLIMKYRVKYCPLCLKESLYHKLSWILYYLNVCPTHRTYLVENCKGCDSPISLKSVMGGFCEKCRCILAYAASENIEHIKVIFEPQMYLYNSLFNPLMAKLTLGLKIDEFLKLVDLSYFLLEGMESYLGDDLLISCFHNKKSSYRDSYKCSHAFNNAYWMYQDFPRDFYRVLNDFIQKKQPPILYEQKGQFEKKLDIESLSVVADAYQRFWIEKIDQGIVRRDFSVFKKNPGLLEKREFLRKDEIRNSKGTSYEKIAQLNELNEITMLTSKRGNRKQYFVEKKSYINALEESRYLITKKEAALMIGIQKDSIPKLIAAGLLNTYHKKSSRYELLSHEEVKSMVDSCLGSFVSNSEVQGIGLHKTMITYSVNGLSIVRIIQFTQSGILKPVTDKINGTLAQNYYLEEEIQSCIELIRSEQQNEQGYFLQHVIALLKIGEKKAHRWMKEGILVPEKIITLTDGRRRYLFSKEMIDGLINTENDCA
jgi:hypothetical protein